MSDCTYIHCTYYICWSKLWIYYLHEKIAKIKASNLKLPHKIDFNSYTDKNTSIRMIISRLVSVWLSVISYIVSGYKYQVTACSMMNKHIAFV